MALGTDNNLVKNMAEIVRNNNLENNNRQWLIKIINQHNNNIDILSYFNKSFYQV